MGCNRNAAAILDNTLGSTGRLTAISSSGITERDTSALRVALPAGLCALLEVSPPAAAGSTYFPTAISLLEHGGRVALMRGVSVAVDIPRGIIVHRELVFCKKWRYSHEQVRRCIQMAETGTLAWGKRDGVETRGQIGLRRSRRQWRRRRRRVSGGRRLWESLQMERASEEEKDAFSG